MNKSPDINSVELGHNESISGRIYLHGFGLIPKYEITTSTPASTDKVFGRLFFKDKDNDGDILVEIPVVAWQLYGDVTFTGLSDDDGYVLFPNGLYVRQAADADQGPLVWGFRLIVFYSGGNLTVT